MCLWFFILGKKMVYISLCEYPVPRSVDSGQHCSLKQFSWWNFLLFSHRIVLSWPLYFSSWAVGTKWEGEALIFKKTSYSLFQSGGRLCPLHHLYSLVMFFSLFSFCRPALALLILCRAVGVMGGRGPPYFGRYLDEGDRVCPPKHIFSLSHLIILS